MASLTFSNALLPLAGTDKTESAEPAKAGFFARFMDALIESRFRAAEREIARHERTYHLRSLPTEVAAVDVKHGDLPFGH